MNIEVDPTGSNRASAMLNSEIRPGAVVGYGVKIFHPIPPNYVTRSPGFDVIASRSGASRPDQQVSKSNAQGLTTGVEYYWPNFPYLHNRAR